MENTAPEARQDFDLLTGIAKGFRAIGKGIANFFIGIYRFFFWFVNVHFRYFFLFVVVYGLVITWAFLHRKDKVPTCSAAAVVYCNGFDNLLLEQEIQNINNLSTPRMYKHLAVLLGISDSACKPLTKISLGIPRDLDNDGLVNKYVFKNELRFAPNTFDEQVRILKKREEGDIFYQQPIDTRIPDMGLLQIEYKSDSLPMFNEFEEALVRYLNNRPRLQAQHKAFLSGLLSEREACDRQLHLIDSFQRVLYFDKKAGLSLQKDYPLLSIAATNNNLTGKEINQISQPPLFYEDVLTLSEKRSELDRRIRLSDQPVSFLSDFQPTIAIKSHSWIIPTFVRCILLGLILGALIDFRKIIWEHIVKQRRIARNKE